MVSSTLIPVMYWVANMSLCKFETHLDYIYDRRFPPRIRMRSSRYSEGRFPSKGQSNCLPPYKSLCGDMRPDLTKIPPNSLSTIFHVERNNVPEKMLCHLIAHHWCTTMPAGHIANLGLGQPPYCYTVKFTSSMHERPSCLPWPASHLGFSYI